MRLIDADGLIKVLKDRATNEAIMGYMTTYDVTNSIIDEVDEQPTAYDVDKVVEKLKYNIIGQLGNDEVIRIPRDKAIEIVRGGGVGA